MIYNDYIKHFIFLDNNTKILYIILFILIIFLVHQLAKIEVRLVYSMFITFIIVSIFFIFNFRDIEKTLKKVSKINKSLDMSQFKNVSDELNICSIYFGIIEFKKIDKYNFIESLKELDRYLEIFKSLKKGNTEYGQLLDLAREKKDNTLNHLISMIHSISPNMVISNIDNVIINSPLENKLVNKINELKSILESYWFEMNNICRIKYENEPITNLSSPIVFDDDAPQPQTKYDNFNYFYGFIDS
jgi:hypothetical protein